MTPLITQHAVDQYRERVVKCCERAIPDDALRRVIAQQIKQAPWHKVGGETFKIEWGPIRPKAKKPWEMVTIYATHTFVIERQAVVTVLGFGMHPSRETSRRKRAFWSRRTHRLLAATARAPAP
jgi:hypothetical protein